MRRWWISVLLLVAVFPFGCGHDERSVEREPRTVAEAYCAYLERCFPQVLQSFSGGGYDGCMEEQLCRQTRNGAAAINDPEECMAMLMGECSWALLAPVRRGSLGPVGLEFPYQSACSEVPWWIGEPERRLEVGDTCFSNAADQFCGPNSHCRNELPERLVGNSLCGTCVEALADGEPCGPKWGYCRDGSQCYEGICTAFGEIVQVCEEDSDCSFLDTCRGGRCEPRIAHTSGEKLGAKCKFSRDCGLDWSLSCWDGRCVSRQREGFECDLFDPDQQQCQLGLFCEPVADYESSEPAPSGTCVKPACVAAACRDEICAVGEVCTLGGRCVAVAGQNEDCSRKPCNDGLFCDGEGERLCLPQRDLGAECRYNAECKSFACDRTSGCDIVEPYFSSCRWDDVGVCVPTLNPAECLDD